MPQLKPLPNTLKLAPTLAQRVFQLREFRNMTVKDLARSARFPHKRIEDIESGLETWLSSSDRQLLAKALTVEPILLEEVESRPLTESGVSEVVMRQLAHDILKGQTSLSCPVCRHELKVSIQEGFDLEGAPIQLPKAYCTKCPFILH